MNLEGLTPEQLAYHEKLQSIGTMTKRTAHGWNQVKEFRNETSGVVRKTKDELGHVVTEHSKTDRQDVTINAQPVTGRMGS